MRPGITIQHASQISRVAPTIRNDVTGFIGFVTRNRWPKGAQKGDFVEFPLDAWAALVSHPVRPLVDAATVEAVRQFFQNGGQNCHIFCVCIDRETDLFTQDPYMDVFSGLMDRLRGEEDLGLLALPVLAYLPMRYVSGRQVELPWQPTLEMFLEHCCEMNNRFLILDTPRDLHGEALFNWVRQFRKANEAVASYGALYYPWVRDGDRASPPSGAVAGIFARVDAEHSPLGVRWPPANELFRGVTHPDVELRWRDADQYIEEHMNVILAQPSRGVVLWGARTLSRDPRWIHINSRRIISFVTEQLRRDSQWVVFENQRPELWEIMRRIVTSRLDSFWNAGLLTGDQAGSEYMVQCDAELNPPEVRDAGQLNVKVMLRPVATAEFIVVELRIGG